MSIKVTESDYFSKTTFISIVYVITMLILSSCLNQSISDNVISTRDTSTPSVTASATKTSIIVATYNPTFVYLATNYAPQISYPTPPPTISNSQVGVLYTLLNSKNCLPPCYLSITPGKTTLPEAVKAMSKLGAGLIAAEKPSPYTFPSSFNFYITYEKTPPSYNVLGDQEIAHSIDLITKNNIVEGIHYHLQTIGYLSEFQEYWKNYSIREILLRNGIPDAVLFSKSTNKEIYDLGLYYETHGISIKLSGTIKDGNLCPDNEENGVRVQAMFLNPKSTLSLFNSSADSMDNTDYWKPIDVVLNITKEKFYSQIVTTNHGCFIIKN